MSDDDDFDMEPVVPRARKKKKSGGALKVGLIVLLVMLGLIAAGAAGAWYFWLSEWYGSGESGEVPVVRADAAPIKVKPKEPGGMAVPDRDKLVYQRMNGGAPVPSGMERLLPPAEEPVPVPAPYEAAPMPAVPVPNPAAVPPPPLTAPKPVVAPSAPAMPTVPAVPAMPAKPGAPVSLAPKPLQAQPVAPAGEPPLVPKTKEPPSAAAKLAGKAPAAPTPKAAAKPAPVTTAKTAKPASAASGAFHIQLGAVRAEASAETEWRRLQRVHKDVLGALSLSVERADLGAKGIYFRLRAGPLANADAAAKACEVLKSRKAPCFPVAPGK